MLAPGVDPRDPEAASELLERGYLGLHEGKTFHQYTDRWEDRPRYVVSLAKIANRPDWASAARYYRLAFRAIARSNDERTAMLAVIPPAMFGNSAPCDREPWDRRNSTVLLIAALTNTFAADWSLRIKAAANVNLFLLNAARLAPSAGIEALLTHAALRLTCNHAGYAALWQEQLGCEWRESQPLHCWPVLPDDDSRQEVRAAIDAAVAHAYGLTRAQYEHVLSTFSHRSYPDAPALCLGKFDEYAVIGAAAFTRKYDPYWDIPLVETLPQPVIELPGVEAHAEEFALNPPPAASENRRGRRRR